MKDKLSELRALLLEINDLESAGAVLLWDQTTYMPPGGAKARGRQLGTLSRLAHEKFTHPIIGRMLAELRSYEESLPYESDEAALIRVTRRDYERAVKVPPSFTAKLSNHGAETYQLWTTARPANDFKSMLPNLEKTLEYSRELANYFPGYDHIADPLIDFADYGMKAATVRKVFQELREELVPIVRSLVERSSADDGCLKQHFPKKQQLAFGNEVIKRFGYDFERGRQDETPHPFTTKLALGDVRITTRVNESNLGYALFSTMHEAGHAVYEQGIRPELEGTPLAHGASMGVHESQSRLWENIVGRGRRFWEFFYPKLQAVFPLQLDDVPLEEFYRAINKVERSLIRTHADEVTYNLHVMIRFDLELQLLEGKLAVRDLPEAWQARYQSDLGIAAPDDRDGVLQDAHWYDGVIGGAFQGYTLGNILSTQFYEAATKAYPSITKEIPNGEFTTLHDWLQNVLYQHGRKFAPMQIIERATGSSLTVKPYLNYIREKYSDLYGVKL
jgi:carboxypeptidase Taq